MTPSLFDRPKIMKKPTFRGARVTGVPRQSVPKAQVLPDDENLPTEIHGIPVASKEEARIGVVLDYLQARYYYQYSVNYGRQRRGGQVLDFLIISIRPYTILDERGRYWHTGIHEDGLEVQKVAQQKHWNLAVCWDDQLKSIDDAMTTIRTLLPFL